MQPLVSIVVPVFNGMPHLVDLTESLLAQDYAPLEIVFTEGGGSDGSEDYLRSLDDPRVRVVSMPKGTSAAGNWTAATLEAKGEFTKLICQDDLLAPDAISRQVADLQASPEAVMAIAQRDIVDARGRTQYRNRGLAGLKGSVLPGDEVIRTCYLQGTNVIGEPLAVLFRTEALKAVMPWRDDNPLMLDLSTYARVAPGQTVVLEHVSVGAFRVSSSSWSTRLSHLQLEQTRRWQQDYENSVTPKPTAHDQRRAARAARRQVMLRRAAYTVLGWKGALNSAK